jgi:hypothetical protein
MPGCGHSFRCELSLQGQGDTSDRHGLSPAGGAWFKKHDRVLAAYPSRTSRRASPLRRRMSLPWQQRRRRRTPSPHGIQRAAPAVAGFGAPMPLGPGIARPHAPQARSHDVTTACGNNGIARKSPKGRKKVAESGRIRGVFEHPYTGGMGRLGSHICRWSSAIGHGVGMVPLRDLREGGSPTLLGSINPTTFRTDDLRPLHVVADRCPGEPGTCDERKFLFGAMIVSGSEGSGGAEARSAVDAGSRNETEAVHAELVLVFCISHLESAPNLLA